MDRVRGDGVVGGHGTGHPDPVALGEREDVGGRRRAVVAEPRGRARELVADIDARLDERLGAAKLRRLRALLQELNAAL